MNEKNSSRKHKVRPGDLPVIDVPPRAPYAPNTLHQEDVSVTTIFQRGPDTFVDIVVVIREGTLPGTYVGLVRRCPDCLVESNAVFSLVRLENR